MVTGLGKEHRPVKGNVTLITFGFLSKLTDC